MKGLCDLLNGELNIIILDRGKGSKALSVGKECGVSGGTILMGRGTKNNPILNFLQLAESNKEIVLVLANKIVGNEFLKKVNEKFKLEKPNNGIAFSVPVSKIMGISNIEGMEKCPSKYESVSKEASGIVGSYDSIFVIVEKGGASNVVDAATKAGARGATIINARGSGIHETSKIFSIEIEPEKEIVLIVAEKSTTDAICDKINEEFEIDKPGKGIIFVQSINKVYGLC